MTSIVFRPEGCSRAGFYADLGHFVMTPLVALLNNSFKAYGYNFEVDIVGTSVWKNFRDNNTDLDLYKVLFKQDKSKTIELPYTKSSADHMTILKDEDFSGMHSLLQKYFVLSDEQQELYNNILAKYNPNLTKTIGIHYRGTDKHTEAHLSPPEEYIKICYDILNEHPDYSIMIQTDQAQVRDLFVSTFKDKCWFIEELPVTQSSQGVHFTYHDRLSLAKYMEIAVRILAQCEYLIVGASNVGTFIGAHRNNPKNVYQFNQFNQLIKYNIA